jgi:FKBP12-rapamycin complex-associated protein
MFGKAHPQALVYPLTVTSKSIDTKREIAAKSIIDEIILDNSILFEQANLVSNELIRCSIIWHESWHESLQEAAKLYFDNGDVEGFMSILEPLHLLLDTPQTIREISFQQAYGRDLKEAWEWCNKYKHSGDKQHINQAWDLYYWIFKKLKIQVVQMNVLELRYISLALRCS